MYSGFGFLRAETPRCWALKGIDRLVFTRKRARLALLRWRRIFGQRVMNSNQSKLVEICMHGLLSVSPFRRNDLWPELDFCWFSLNGLNLKSRSERVGFKHCLAKKHVILRTVVSA